MAPLTEEEEERGVTPKLKEVYARADFVNMVSDIYARAIDGEVLKSGPLPSPDSFCPNVVLTAITIARILHPGEQGRRSAGWSHGVTADPLRG